MNLYFDLDTGVFCSSPGSRDTVSTLSFKRGDTVSLAVRFISGIVVQELGSGATGKLGLKESGEYDADFVASDTAWTKTGTGTSTVYTFELNLNTSELNALLGHDGTEGNDVASVDLMMEMEWTVSGVTTSSNTITATVRNDVVKGSESGPAEISGGTPVEPAAAELSVNFGGSNNAILFTAVEAGVAGNSITIEVVAGGSLDVTVASGTSILISYVDNSTTAQAVINAVNADPEASLLVTAANFSPDNGTGVMSTVAEELAPTALSGGADATPGVLGSMRVDADFLYVVCQVSGGAPTWKKIALSAL